MGTSFGIHGFGSECDSYGLFYFSYIFSRLCAVSSFPNGPSSVKESQSHMLLLRYFFDVSSFIR